MTTLTEFLNWPDTEHPAYTDQAASIRALMADSKRYALKVPFSVGPPLVAAYGAPAYPLAPKVGTRILTIKRAFGPAPYVGRGFVYMWDVAIDDLGRWVAGPTRIKLLEWDPMHDEWR